MVTEFSEFRIQLRALRKIFHLTCIQLFLNVIPDKLEKPKTGSMNFQGVILVLKPTQKLQVNLNNKQEEYFRWVKLESDQIGRKTEMPFNLLCVCSVMSNFL